MSRCKEYKLGDIVELVGGGTPKTSNPNYWNGDIPWLSVVDFNNGKKYVSLTEKNITEDGFNNSSTKILDKGDIIISARGTVGVIAMLDKPMAFNQSCYGIKSKDEFSFNDYLYYLLKNSVAELSQFSHGGVFDTITRDTFNEIDILLPPLPEQKVIASLLSSLDDKIDLLHRQNATLEKMAETIFRQWFVKDAKEEWKEIVITELFEVKDGTHDSPKKEEFGKKLITSKHLSGNSIDFYSAYYISDEDYQQINQRSKVDTRDILFSMIGTIGRIYLEQSDEVNYAIKNLGLFKTSQNSIWTYFTFLWLKSSIGEEFIHEHRSGSTQEYIALGSLRNIVFKVPTIDRVEEFNNLVTPYFLKIKTNQQQIQSLTSLRDTLLPKLISGEVRVEM